MSQFGVTPTGFVVKRLADIRNSMQQRLSTVRDPKTGETLQIDFNEDDPFIQVINAVNDEIAIAWETAADVYSNYDPSRSIGSGLSGLVQLNGITRQLGEPTRINIQVEGAIGLTLPIGEQISDDQRTVIYVTDAPIVIAPNGVGTGTALSNVNGNFTPTDNTITNIITPLPGWETVTNTGIASAGRADENDPSLRSRRSQSTAAPASAIVDSIRAALLNVTNVTFARVLVNSDDTTDSRGIPAKRFAAVVQGGEQSDITMTLFTRFGLGIRTFGNVADNYTDNSGNVHQVAFIRPTNVPIYVEIDLTVLNSTVFGTDSPDDIRAAIVAYAAGGASALDCSDDFGDNGFVPGEDVIRSRLYTPINSVGGHTVTRLQIGTAAGVVSDNDVTIAFDAVSQFIADDTHIVINVTTP